jgi:hypothetical protein
MGEKMKSKMQQTIDKTRDYLDYIEEHYNNVQTAWKIVQEKCNDMKFIYDDYIWHNLDSDIQEHDLSKLSEDEFIQYRKCFYSLKGEVVGDLTAAWSHHLEHNHHHWETVNECDPLDINCVHMVIDWMAMGIKFGDTAQDYYENNVDKIKLSDINIKFIYEIFERIK